MSKYAYEANKITGLRALHDHVLVVDMQFGSRTLSSGLMLLNDDGKGDGIRPRWGKVYAIGPEQMDISVGQYILISHGRWTRGIKIDDGTGEKTIRKVDNKDILLVSDKPVFDTTMSDKVM